jgi:CRP-like cAMP-binding protein
MNKMTNAVVNNTETLTSALFRGLEGAASKEVLAPARLKKVPAGRFIVTEGESAGHFFLLKHGRVKYFRTTEAGEEVLLWWLVAGDVLGIAALLEDPPPYIGSAEALSDSELFVWDHVVVRRLVAIYPQLLENSLRMAIQCLRDYTERHVGLMTRTARQRLARALLELGDRAGKAGPKGLEIAVTNQQLGGLSDTSPFTASRLLKDWQHRGAITKHRGNVLIHDPELLIV